MQEQKKTKTLMLFVQDQSKILHFKKKKQIKWIRLIREETEYNLTKYKIKFHS